MKYFLLFFLSLCLFAQNVFATTSQFPDPSRLQPIPSDAHSNNPLIINKGEINSATVDSNSGNPSSTQTTQASQCEFSENSLDKNKSYIDAAGHRLFVSDTNNNRVFIFNLSFDNVLVDCVPDNVLGQPDFVATDPGSSQSELNGPNGIAYDQESQTLFVADTNNNRIMVFNVSTITNGENAINVLGQPDFSNHDAGSTESKLNNPYSFGYDFVHKILFVTDSGNNRIMVFNVSTITNGENAINVLGQPDFSNHDAGSTESKLNNPKGIAYDKVNKKIFVADTKNNRTMVFGVELISNGESAFNIIAPREYKTMGQEILERIQGKTDAPVQRQKIPWSVIIFCLVVFLVTVVLLLPLGRAK